MDWADEITTVGQLRGDGKRLDERCSGSKSRGVDARAAFDGSMPLRKCAFMCQDSCGEVPLYKYKLSYFSKLLFNILPSAIE